MHPADSSQYNVAVICCNKCFPIAAGNWISKAIENAKVDEIPRKRQKMERQQNES